ncbi:universal stress protein [Niabella beijingensis]|uniref:universal stress protein n=1 Tax=Niabella beijingensis TaxID=2872700 RepID=UPI001CBA8EE4|nr:universal stress protein [Niabella beijingensis]MBZ4191607.1 universal stress protein [Niabella beijingensis]
MKKILFVCDGDNYSHEAFEFIKQIQQYEPLLVKGIFFSTVEISELIYASYALENNNELRDAEKGIPSQVIERFVNQCKTNNIQHIVKEEMGTSWNKVFWRKETRFADLMIISQKMLCNNIDAQQPNEYMLELLRWADCPVLSVPEKATNFEQIIGAYDGSQESTHALTAFCKTFPQYSNLPANFVYVKNEESDKIPDLELLEEYVNAHFKNAEPYILKSNSLIFVAVFFTSVPTFSTSVHTF